MAPTQRRRPLVRLSVSDAYADEEQQNAPESESEDDAPPPVAPPPMGPVVMRAPPRPIVMPPRPVPRQQNRPVLPVPRPGQRQLTVKEKRFRLWILAMQKLYEDEAFAKEKKVRVQKIKIPVPVYDASESVLYNEQTMQQAAWKALKPFSKWLKVSEAAAEEIVKDYIKRKRLQIGSGVMPIAVPKGALVYQGSLGGQHG